MWKRVLACALVCLLLFSIAFCPYRPLTVTDPQLGALERDLREKYPHVAGLRVSVYRPTLYWDVTLQSDELEGEVFAYLVELIHKYGIPEVIEGKSKFKYPYHRWNWEHSMQINIRVKGVFSQLHRQYDGNYFAQEPERSGEIDNFRTWYLRRDIHRPDGENLRETVTPLPAAPAPAVNETLDEAVSDAVIRHFRPDFLRGVYQTFATEYHKTIGTAESDGAVTVYIVTLYAQYHLAGDDIALTGAVFTPAALTFAATENGYELQEFWEAENGVRFEPSIREKFPEEIAEATLELMSRGLADAMEICDERARAHFGVPEGGK
jgi:hypothetical protein